MIPHGGRPLIFGIARPVLEDLHPSEAGRGGLRVERTTAKQETASIRGETS
jgi:hypothetical protein